MPSMRSNRLAVRGIHDIATPSSLASSSPSLAGLQDESFPEKIEALGRTLRRWLSQTTSWHEAGVRNGPTEAVNRLIKRIKRIGFGLRALRNYRIRARLYDAGRPNWDLLATIGPRRNPKRLSGASEMSGV